MIKSGDLENRAATPGNAGPDPKGSEAVLEDLAKVKGRRAPEPTPAEEELAKLKQRLVEAKELRAPRGVEDTRSWYMGRDAALYFLEREEA